MFSPIIIRLAIMGGVVAAGAFLASKSVKKNDAENKPAAEETLRADEPAPLTPEQRAARKKKREEKEAKKIAKAVEDALTVERAKKNAEGESEGA